MNPSFDEQFQGLLEKYCELITGSNDPEMIEKIKIWSIYNHIHKSMPALTSHWNQSHPDSKADIRKLFEEVRDLNQKLTNKSNSYKF
ncbi:hypothetical protein J31TS4_45430 [Paenibacillus sp. J31TS4]|uniref:YusU family protein n=1 Tax=Paenibacillus sp. J31TS4 TaxID=2807195 RepID=UPI001B19D850|nr:YusU family protein [Paenibacillus sp. J31TS4]GIP41263.1 hypothetical protein J31TS4_45430 [Paenibacillus sp. J31TS4]